MTDMSKMKPDDLLPEIDLGCKVKPDLSESIIDYSLRNFKTPIQAFKEMKENDLTVGDVLGHMNF